MRYLADRDLRERLIGPAPLTPGDFPTNLMGWWSADTITGLSNGDPVATWPDLSGNSRDFTQATGASQPTYVTEAFNTLPAVEWDGTTNIFMDSPTFSAVAQPGTWLIVAQSASGAGYSLVDGQSSGNRWAVGALGAGNTDLGLFAGSISTANVMAGSTWALDVILATFNSSTSRIMLTSAFNFRGGGQSGTDSITGFRLGRHQSVTSRVFTGYICELAVWNRNSDSVNFPGMSTLVRDLARKWGIAVP